MTTIRLAAALAAFAFLITPAFGEIVDFDDLSLSPNSHWNGPDPNGVDVPGPFGTTERVGSFTSHGVEFGNRYDLTFGSWSGFAYTNESDTTTPGFSNQFSAIMGTGRGPGADIYGIGAGAGDASSFDPSVAADLLALPSLTLPGGFSATGLYVTNTTYAALSMRDGDAFAKKFGGLTGADPDWFKLSIYGLNALGVPLPGFAEFYLADYRFANDSLDYIVTDWAPVDLAPLAGAQSLHFSLTSSDIGPFGMNTPAFFAVDDLQIAPAAVPEPSSMLLLAGSMLAAGAVHRIRRRRLAE
jgi:hypothetical protein